MADSEVKIKFAGEDDGLAAEAQKEAGAINRITAAREANTRAERQALALRQQIRQIEREQRKAAFDRLPLEEQVNQLLARRNELQKKLNQPGTQRSERSQLAYEAAFKLNDFQLQEKQAALSQQRKADGDRAARLKQLSDDNAAQIAARADLEKRAAQDQAAADKRRSINERIAANQREINALQKRDRDTAFEKLKPAEQLLQLEQRRERILQTLNRSNLSDLQRSAVQLALRRTEGTIATVRDRQPPSFGSAARDFLGNQVNQLAGAVGFDRLFSFARQQSQRIIQEAGRTVDLAERLSTDTGTAQQFSFAAGKTNLTDEDLGTTLKSLGLAQEKAQRGDQETVGMFERFGISVQQLRQSKPDELFKQIAINAQQGKIAAASLKDATVVLGRGADRVLAALRNGFAEAMAELAANGGIIDRKTLVELDDAKESFKLLSMVMTAQFAPAVSYVIEKLVSLLPQLKRLGDNTPVGAIGRFAGALSGGGTFGGATRAALLGGNEAGNALEAALRRAELNKQAKDNAIAFREEQLKKLNAAATGEADPARRKELETAARQASRELKRLKSGRDPELERQARLEELKAEVAKLQKDAAYERLTREEKIAALEREKRAEADKITTNSDEEDRLQAEIKQAELDKKIAGLQNDSGKDKLETVATIQRDALTRVGLFTGNAGVTVPNAIKEQKQTLTRIANGIEKIDRNTSVLTKR